MKYKIVEDGIIVDKAEYFNPFDTVKCGQVFRYTINNDVITIYSKKYKAVIKEFDTYYYIYTNVPNYFVNYLDFDRNYGIIYTKLVDKGLIRECVDFSKGIHILNQDPMEMIFSFIISANNNIPRIQKIIAKLCEGLGENMGDYYAFPTITELRSASEDFFKSIGAGYRADYLYKTSHMITEDMVEEMKKLSTDELIVSLQKLQGVGPKVADCIALFGFHRGDVCPVDTWIKKVYNTYFGTSDNPKFIRKDLTDRFEDLSGYMQQYLFYYQRELN